MNKLKGLLKTRTFWFNVASAGLELTGVLGAFVPPGTATVAVNLINIGLRLVTKTAVEDR